MKIRLIFICCVLLNMVLINNSHINDSISNVRYIENLFRRHYSNYYSNTKRISNGKYSFSIDTSNPNCRSECYLNCFTQFNTELELKYCIFNLCECKEVYDKELMTIKSESIHTRERQSRYIITNKTLEVDVIGKLKSFLIKFTVLSILFIIIYYAIRQLFFNTTNETNSIKIN